MSADTYPVGTKVPMLTMYLPGEIVEVTTFEGAPLYRVEYRVWPGEPVRSEWMGTDLLEAHLRLDKPAAEARAA